MRFIYWFIVGLFLSHQVAFAGITAKANTWQMMGYGTDVNLTTTTTPTADQFSLIWYFEDGNWKAFSKDASLIAKIKDLGLYGDSIKAGQAFWVKAKKDFSFIPYIPEVDTLPATKGWHLVSLGQGFSAKGIGQVGSSMFVYRQEKWSYAYADQNNSIIQSKPYLYANTGEGFWIFNPATLAEIDSYSAWNYSYEPWLFSDTFSNKSFAFGNTQITLDQNGTTISNDTRYDGGKWIGLTYDEWSVPGIEFQIIKMDKRYTFAFSKNYDSSNSYHLYAIYRSKFKKLPNGVNETLEHNATSYFDYNDPNSAITATVVDYNRSKVLQASVKDALDKLRSTFEGNTADSRSAFTAIKNELQPLSGNQNAKVILAMVDLVEILDTDIVKNSLLINSNPLNLNSFLTIFPQSSDAIISLATNITSYSTSARTIMQTFATRLKSDADVLKTVQDDENFYLSYDGKSINFADLKVLRGAMLGLAFKMQYLASYELGANEWFTIQNESGIQFRKAQYDTVSFLNSKTFFTAPDAMKLANAKSLFREFVEAYYELLSGEYYQREGMIVPGAKLNRRNLRRHLKLILDNLNGKSPQATYLDDWTEWTGNNTVQKKKKMVFDFNALFNPSTAITINDFPSFAYNGTFDPQNSKIENSPFDANWTPLQVIANSSFTSKNNINAFLKYFQNNGVTFTDSSLLNEIFNR